MKQMSIKYVQKVKIHIFVAKTEFILKLCFLMGHHF